MTGAAAAAAAATVAATPAPRPPRPPQLPHRVRIAGDADAGAPTNAHHMTAAYSAPALFPVAEAAAVANGGESQSVYNLQAMMRARGDRGYGTPASPDYILPETPPASTPPPLPQSQFVATPGPYRPPPR